MIKVIIILACLFLVFRLGTSLQHVKGTPLKLDGSQVEFQFTNDYRMIAGLGADISGQYLVVGGAPVNGVQMGHLAVLPMAIANQFKAKYGDYRKCSNAGANEAKESVINMSVVIEDWQAQNVLKEIAAQVKNGSDPVITIEGSRLDLIKYYYSDEKEPQGAEHFFTNNQFYFIKFLKIDSLN